MHRSLEPIRVLYVEDDPALRDLLAAQLCADPRVAGVDGVAAPREAVAAIEAARYDAALIDLSLGAVQINGYELGLALRAIDRRLPIVMFSQYPGGRLDEVIPRGQRHHWSYAQKRGSVPVKDLVDLLCDTICGESRFEVSTDDDAAGCVAPVTLDRLTPRQREVIALAATGMDARAIAEHLHLAHVSVRRELSRSYKVLVPDAPPGTDLRTAAVLAYLRHLDGVAAPVA